MRVRLPTAALVHNDASGRLWLIRFPGAQGRGYIVHADPAGELAVVSSAHKGGNVKPLVRARLMPTIACVIRVALATLT